MKFITGDETGLIKQILIESKKIQRWGVQKRELSIERMRWCGPVGDEESEIAVVLKNGIIRVWNIKDTKATLEYNSENENPKGLEIIYNEEKRNILTCNEEGHVIYYSIDEDSVIDEFDVEGPVDSMRICPFDSDVFAVGGKENDLKVYRLSDHSLIWQARNVPHDFLDLRVPVHIKDFAFLKCERGYKIVTVTGYNQIRVYLTQKKRQPVEDYSLGDKPFVYCVVSKDESYLYVSDTTGRVSAFNLLTHRLFGVFKGNVGSVRCIALHPTLPLLATVGLDRILRVYNTETRDLKHRIYLRQKLNFVLFSKEEEIQIEEEKEEEEEKKEEEEKEEKEKNEGFSDSDLLMTSDDEDEDDNDDSNDESSDDSDENSTNDDENVFKDDYDSDDDDEDSE